jgi:membrane associated rhomboid family serine protease
LEAQVDVFFFFLIMVILVIIASSIVLPTPVSDIGAVSYRTFPWMTLLLIVVNALVFMIWQAPELYQAASLEEAYPYIERIYTYGLRGSILREGLSVGAFTTFTSMFMHADHWHLLFNMIYLWTFGRRVEDACGAWRFLLFYLAAGMVANIGSTLLNPALQDLPGIGASGAIFGVMGAFLVLFPGARVQCIWIIGSVLRIPIAAIRGKPLWSWFIALPAWILLILFAVLEALPSIQTVVTGEVGVGDNINHLAHLMGFLAAVLIFFYVRKDLLLRYVQRRTL